MHYRLKAGVTLDEVSLVQTVKPVLSKRDIEIQKGEFNKYPWVKIFSCILQSNARKLSTYGNQAPIQLKFIFLPLFPQLKELYLTYNLITSLESIAKLDAPNLEDINLQSNKITSINSLRKANFPQLKQINISNNPIQDPTPLIYLPSKHLRQIHIQRWPNLPMIGQSKRWALKLYPQPSDLKALTMKSKERRLEMHIDKMIEAKYPVFKNN